MIRYISVTRGKVGPVAGASRVEVPIEIPCASTAMCDWALGEAVRRYAEEQRCNVTQIHVFGSFGGPPIIRAERERAGK